MTESFGRWLRIHREAAGLTRRDLAGAARLSVATLKAVEADQIDPTPGQRERLEAAVGAVWMRQ